MIGVSFLSDDSNQIILGDIFLRNFVSTFDYKNKKVTLGINVNAPDGVQISRKPLPPSKELSSLQMVGIVAAGICVLALIPLLIFCACKKLKKNRTGQHPYYEVS